MCLQNMNQSSEPNPNSEDTSVRELLSHIEAKVSRLKRKKKENRVVPPPVAVEDVEKEGMTTFNYINESLVHLEFLSVVYYKIQ